MQSFDAAKHVQIAGRVLLDDIGHIVRSQGLAKLPPRHKVLDLAQSPDRHFLRAGQLRLAVVVVIALVRAVVVIRPQQAARVQLAEEVERAMGERGLDRRDL